KVTGEHFARQSDLAQQRGKFPRRGRIARLGLSDESSKCNGFAVHECLQDDRWDYICSRQTGATVISHPAVHGFLVAPPNIFYLKSCSRTRRAAGAVPSSDVSVAEIDPMITLACMRIGTRAGSFVNHTRTLPSFKKSPRNV